MIINWYPGHMAKARRLIEGNLKIIDVAIELVDARIPMSSTNPMIGQLLGQKPSIVVMNKADLADTEILKLWTAYYKEQGRMVMALNSKDGKGIKQLVQAVRTLAEPKLVKWRAKGLKSRSVRTIILGIPNVGKSTLINRLAGRNATKTADKPGETKGKQWVHLADNLDLLDTPGVLWPKLEEQKCARRLAATGAISDTVYDMEEVVADLITTLSVRYSEALKKRFKLSEIDEDPYKTIERIGRNRGAVLPGNRIDMEKTYKLIIKDFREGHIGPISLDMPEEFAEKQDG
ncbi:MAG: ribosome biogenesis GTPase YlqF [Megasphaera micronuciformis]|nr:ribosome biogenesis GTPase YlqF [Megasphaera micronuciformis]